MEGVLLKTPEQIMRRNGSDQELYGLRASRLGHEKGSRSSQVPTTGLGLSTFLDLTV